MYSKHAGFTLMEIMVVVAIMGGLMGLAVTNMDFLMPSSRLNASAREIASTFMFMYNRAAINGEDTVLAYDLDNARYQVKVIQNGVMEAYKPYTLAKGIKFADILAAGERKKTGGTFEVYIAPNGVVRAHVVHLQNPEGEYVSIEVNPISGDVQVNKGYKELDFVLE